MNKYKISKELLIKEYIKKYKSAYQIAKEFGCGSSTIYRYLKKFNIKIRNRSEGHAKVSGNKNPFFGKHHTEKSKGEMKENHRDVFGKNNSMFGKRGKETGNYIDGRWGKKYHCIECGKQICYCNWKYGSKLCNSCKQKNERNHSYVNGKSHEPYSSDFTASLKLKIRERDNFECQECDMIEEEHLIVYGRVLDIHHIDYDKENCDEDNLITLCKQCNIRANFNRKYWEKYFREKIKI